MNMLMESAIDPSGDTGVMLYVTLSLVGLCLEVMAYNKLYGWSVNWCRRRSGGIKNTTDCLSDQTRSMIGIVWSGIFILTGLFIMVPVFGVFGVFWTLFPVILEGLYVYQALKRRCSGPRINIGGGKNPSSPPKARRQLEQLESLKAAGLMTDQEYRQKRQEILKGL